MLDKLKQMAQAKGLSDEIKNEKAVIERQGVRVIVKGDFTVEEIVLNKELDIEDQAVLLKELFNEAVKELQMKMAKKMMGMGL